MTWLGDGYIGNMRDIFAIVAATHETIAPSVPPKKESRESGRERACGYVRSSSTCAAKNVRADHS